MPLRRVGVMNLILISSCPFRMQRREAALSDTVINYFNVACIQTFTERFFFKFGMLIGTTLHYILVSLDDLNLYLRSQLHEKLDPPLSFCSEFVLLISMKFSMLPQPVGLLKLRLNPFCAIFKGENFADVVLGNKRLTFCPVSGH